MRTSRFAMFTLVAWQASCVATPLPPPPLAIESHQASAASPPVASTASPEELPTIHSGPPEAFVVGDGISANVPNESAINTPVPVFVRVDDPAIGIDVVRVRYKAFGDSKWSTIPLAKTEEGFGVELPCTAVSTTGRLKIFVVALDKTGTPVATAGSMKQPISTEIKQKIEGPAPALPGKRPPRRCVMIDEGMVQQ